MSFRALRLRNLTFGQDAARAAISEELGQLLGPGGGDVIKSVLERSSDPGSGTVAAIFGVLTVLLAASGVFGEMHPALNATFKAKPSDEPISSLIRTRAASLNLVTALGFMLVRSLAASAGLSALAHVFQGLFAGKILLAVLNTVVSLAIFTLLFRAIYKVLPDTAIPGATLYWAHLSQPCSSPSESRLSECISVARRPVRPMARPAR
jgi:membrane protein